MSSALMQRLRRLEKARAKVGGNPLALLVEALRVIADPGAVRADADGAVKAIPRGKLRLFARGLLSRIGSARELAAADEAEDGDDAAPEGAR